MPLQRFRRTYRDNRTILATRVSVNIGAEAGHDLGAKAGQLRLI